MEQCICFKCFDSRTITCDKCKAKCQVFYKSNCHLIDEDNGYEMKKCNECNNFICFTCDENERNGAQSVCNEEKCDCIIGYYCNICVNQPGFCNKHLILPYDEKLLCSISYDEAVDILLNGNCCFGLYDKEAQIWRTAMFYMKWDNTKRLMVQFTDSCGLTSGKYLIIKDSCSIY
eukprot:227302_1